MNKEILKKIKEIKGIASRYKGFNSIADRVEELETLIKSEEPQEKPECDFLPGQILKVWDDDPENWAVDAFEKYDKNSSYQFKCKRNNWKHAEPIPVKNLITTIAHNMPDAVKAVIDIYGELNFYYADGNIIMNDVRYQIPYPNNTGKDIEIEIKR
jgi:hypothetical protein